MFFSALKVEFYYHKNLQKIQQKKNRRKKNEKNLCLVRKSK